MRNTILTISIFTAAIIAAVTSCGGISTAKSDPMAATYDSAAMVKRGEYLVTIGGCDDCHSPKNMGPNGPEIDMSKRLSGFPSSRPIPAFDSNLVKKGIAQFNGDLTAAAGPWGISFAANITSDASGLGNWSLDHFRYAMRHGKWKGLEGSRPLLPPMPWFNIAKMTDLDLEAVYTFLKSTKPVENIVPAPRQFSDIK
jgi:hypothetical protein